MKINWFIGVDISKLFFDVAIYDKGESKRLQPSKFGNYSGCNIIDFPQQVG